MSQAKLTAEVISWGGYWAVVTKVPGQPQWLVHANRFRSFETAQKSAARRNAKHAK